MRVEVQRSLSLLDLTDKTTIITMAIVRSSIFTDSFFCWAVLASLLFCGWSSSEPSTRVISVTGFPIVVSSRTAIPTTKMPTPPTPTPSSSSSSRLWSEGGSSSQSTVESFPIQKSDEEWKSVLTPEQYYVLRKEGTETPGASPLNNIKPGQGDQGTFSCAGCGSPLFVAETKFESGTGWPSFFAPITSSAIKLNTDYKLILPRTECVCSQCGGHLGHVFEDGPEPTGQRYCMNGAALTYKSDEESPELALEVQQRQQTDPFKLSPQQVLPSLIVNGLITLFFLSSSVSGIQQQQEQGQLSPVAILTILPALYYGFVTTKSLSKLLG